MDRLGFGFIRPDMDPGEIDDDWTRSLQGFKLAAVRCGNMENFIT